LESITIKLNDLSLGWVCGLIEGEGSFNVYEDKRRSGTFNCKIQVESTDFDVIETLQDALGGRIWESNYPSKYKAFPNAKPSWRWAVSSKKECESICNLIYPYMSKRRQEQINKLKPYLKYKRKFKKIDN